ncbi:MAG: T9SS C-terminal target domain-containing protein [Cytophagales bacterium]|nr:MAG: T9SS C-terminal target domain-containing protein [Cytophagales bacterium]TAF59644.1 MAG: T9SS C-terminal target domain-containing protein [Cytophagales bacterium]
MKTLILTLFLGLAINEQILAQNFAGGTGSGYASVVLTLSPNKIKERKPTAFEIRCFPTPIAASSELNIIANERLGLESCEFLNLWGQSIVETPFSAKLQLPAQLSAGFYILRIKARNGESVYKKIQIF